MAWGTNTGIGKMSKISDQTADVLQTASDNFIRPETLHEANRRIVDEIASLIYFINTISAKRFIRACFQ